MPTPPTHTTSSMGGRPPTRRYDLSGDDRDKWEIYNGCPNCSGVNVIKLQGSQYFDYFQRGNYIQKAFPQLDASDRELIMTGMHPECWDEMMKDEED